MNKRQIFQVVLVTSFVLAACVGPSGPAGTSGVSAVLSVNNVDAGTICALGGVCVSYGADKNGNGTLDADEVTGNKCVCEQQGPTGSTGAT